MSRSTTRRSYRYRCNHRVRGQLCAARARFPQKVEDYVRVPKCTRCGSNRHWWWADPSRLRELEKRNDTCYCPGEAFPHQQGSIRGCERHPLNLAGVDMTEDEYDDYRARWETRRNG